MLELLDLAYSNFRIIFRKSQRLIHENIYVNIEKKHLITLLAEVEKPSVT